MSNSKRNVTNSNVYASLSAVLMSQGDRVRAITALQDGEMIAELILKVAHTLRQLVTMQGLKPNFKH